MGLRRSIWGDATPTIEERFWGKVAKTETCWLWTGAKARGYGRFCIKGRKAYAHRVAYELLVGPIPARLTLDHLCRVRACIKPEHLEPITMRDNILRGVGIAAQESRRTHCPRGHPYDLFNTYLFPGRLHRRCRQCSTKRNKR